MPCLFPVLIAAACAEAPPQQAPLRVAAPLPAPAFVARGTEPFWSLRIEHGRARYETPEQPDGISIPVRGVSTRTGLRFTGRGMQADYSYSPCRDGMSERIYSMRVRLTINGRRLAGCADRVLPPGGLAGRDFTVTAVDEMAAPNVLARLSFSAARLSGNSGCNTLSGPWRAERKRLLAGPLAMTRRACAGPAMRFEARLSELLGQPLEVVMLPGERLRLMAGEGGSITLAPRR